MQLYQIFPQLTNSEDPLLQQKAEVIFRDNLPQWKVKQKDAYFCEKGISFPLLLQPWDEDERDWLQRSAYVGWDGRPL